MSRYTNNAYFRCELLKILREISSSLKESKVCSKRIGELERRVKILEKLVHERERQRTKGPSVTSPRGEEALKLGREEEGRDFDCE